MSALGQKRTLAVQKGMSAFAPKAAHQATRLSRALSVSSLGHVSLQQAAERNGLFNLLRRWVAFIGMRASIARFVCVLKTAVAFLQKAFQPRVCCVLYQVRMQSRDVVFDPVALL